MGRYYKIVSMLSVLCLVLQPLERKFVIYLRPASTAPCSVSVIHPCDVIRPDGISRYIVQIHLSLVVSFKLVDSLYRL